MGKVLGIVYRTLATHITKKAGYSRHRVTITPAKRNKAKQALPTGQDKTRAQKHQSMIWAQRLKRVFGIEIETCEQCGGAVKVIASIDKSAVKPICTSIGDPKDTQSPEYKK